MRILVIVIMLSLGAFSCLQPIKPIPPIGCSYDDAHLMCDSNCKCVWVYLDC